MIIFLAAVCLAVSAHGYLGYYDSGGNTQRWALVNLNTGIHTNVVNQATRAIRYFIAEDACSATNRAAEYNAVRASFAQWQAVPGTVLKFEDAGLAPAGIDINISDNTNVVYWTKNSLWVNGGYDYIAGALGVCFTGMRENNTIDNADVVLNAVQNQWFTDYFAPNDNACFVEAVLVHELGHAIGLGHVTAGGATMLPFTKKGLPGHFGLSADEVAAVRSLYGTPATITNLANLEGTVTKGGNPVLGAAVMLEDTNGAVAACTLTRSDGRYHFACIPPGAYRVRATPLDPPALGDTLVTSTDIDGVTDGEFSGADLAFICPTNYPVSLTAGMTSSLNVPVLAAAPAFYISMIRTPTSNPGSYSISSLPVSLSPGQSNMTIGVFAADLPTSGATLSVTGSGISLTGQTVQDGLFPGLVGISAVINIASNAVPGMRSLVVTKGTNVAFANGYLVINPLVQDNNFDGLSDRFQRQYFPLYTSAQAAPASDSDGDGLSNQGESVAGTVPTNAVSVLKLDSVTQTTSGTTLRWRSVAGKKYQVYGRAQVSGAAWQALGTPVTASGTQTQYLDAGATSGLKFYTVQVLP